MKINGLIYLLHPGQFFWEDRDTKIPLNIDETNFIATQHQVISKLRNHFNKVRFAFAVDLY